MVPAVDLGGVLEEVRCQYKALEVELQAQLTLVSSFVDVEDSAGLPLPMGNSQVQYMPHLDTDQGPSFNLTSSPLQEHSCGEGGSANVS